METNILTMFDQMTDKIKQMVEESVVIGKIMTYNDISVMPISKVKTGFITGGVNQKAEKSSNDPFGGAAGGTLTITPLAFLVITKNDVKVLHLNENSHILENLIELIPEAGKQILSLVKKKE